MSSLHMLDMLPPSYSRNWKISSSQRLPEITGAFTILQDVLYTVSAIVIYVFVGLGVASPALNFASPLIKKVAYGIAVPTVREQFFFFFFLAGGTHR